MIIQHGITEAIVDYFSGRESALDLRDARAVVLWVADGFGLAQLASFRRENWTSLLGEVPLEAASAFPTTTAAGLATLAFAAPPAHHGALGYWIYLSEWDRPVNMLSGRDDRGAEVPGHLMYRPMATIFDRLAEHGIASSVVSPEPYRDTGLSRWLYQGARYCGYNPDHPTEALQSTHRALREGARFIWLYWPYFDATAHTEGLYAAQTEVQARRLDSAVAAAKPLWSPHAPLALVITADHGMAHLDLDRVVSRDDPLAAAIWQLPYAGERRAITTSLSVAQLKELGTFDTAEAVLSQDQLWEEGWYGGAPAHPSFRRRVLSSLVLAKEGGQFCQDGFRDSPVLRAGHGGRTYEEQTIPVWCSVWPH